MKIKNKNIQIFLVFILFSLSLGLVHLLLESTYTIKDTKKTILKSAKNSMIEKEIIFNNFLNHAQKNILAIRNSDTFKQFLSNRDNPKQLKDLFKTFTLANEDYMQLRFIDKDGNETIRIDRKKQEHENISFIKDLQNKADRYYFTESIEKKDSQVWFSALDLNVEGGKIQIPYVPTIRTILPIRVEGNFEGILVINHHLNSLINEIIKSSIFDTILVDENGFFLYHYDKNKSWSEYKKEKFTLESEFPENYLKIINSSDFTNDQFASRNLQINFLDNIYLIYQIKDEYIKNQKENKMNLKIFEVLLFIFLSILFSSLIIKVFGNIFNDFDEQKLLNEKLELASNVAQIGFWDYEAESKMIFLSKNLKELFGKLKHEKMLIEDFFFLILEENDKLIKDKFYNSIKEKKEFSLKHRIVVNSEDRFFEIVGKHFYNRNGEHFKTIGSAIDITERYITEKLNEKVTKQAKEFKKLFDRFDENVIASATDARGVINYTSKAFCEISGFSKEELLGSPQNIVRHPDTPPEVFKELWQTIKSGKVWQGELKNKAKNGGIYWVNAHIYPEFDEDNKIIGYSAIRHDITAKKQVEFLSKKTNESIEFSRFIQHSLLPQRESIRACVKDKFIIWEPKDVIGGDIYNLSKPLSKDECLIMVIDCTGHGVPGAFVTMLVKAIEKQYLEILKNKKEYELNLSDILNFYNKMMKTILNQDNKALASNVGFDGGILYFNKAKKIVKFAGASNNMLFYDNEKINLIKGDRVSIGFKNSKDDFIYKVHELKVEDGMKFYLYSDGFIDQIGGDKGFPFGRKRFTSILGNNINKSMAEQKEILLDELKAYQKDYERVDDITVIGFEI